MNRIENIKIKIEKAKYLWESIKFYVNGLENTNEFIGIKAFGKKLKLSKNTIKKYIRLALESKVKFFEYIVIPKIRETTFPLGISVLIAHHYVAACREREKITKGKKTRITFDTFIKDYSQDYFLEGLIYKPKRTYIINAIKFHGFYSQLCTHKTKQSARFKKTKWEQWAIENSMIMKKIGLLEELKITTKKYSKIINDAPSRQISFLPGVRVEIDASKEYWGEEQWTVYTAIDSSTGFKVAEYIDKEETNLGYLMLLKIMLSKYGRPQQIVTDKRRGWDGKGAAQIRDFLEPLGIQLFASSDPNAKPKVERSFRTMENDFYYKELKKRNALTFEKAKKYTIEIMNEYNKYYNKIFDYKNSCYIKLSKAEWSNIKIEYFVKFKNTQTLNFMGVEYGLMDKSKRRIYYPPKMVKIIINAFGEMYIENLNYRLYLDIDSIKKKTVVPSKKDLQQLLKDLNKLSKVATKEEIKVLTKMIHSVISKQKRNISI